jgi:hypothetical protein
VTHYRDGRVTEWRVAVHPLRHVAPHIVDVRVSFHACDRCEWAARSCTQSAVGSVS